MVQLMRLPAGFEDATDGFVTFWGQTKHEQTKHEQTKHEQTKHEQTKHEQTKHEQTKHEQTQDQTGENSEDDGAHRSPVTTGSTPSEKM